MSDILNGPPAESSPAPISPPSDVTPAQGQPAGGGDWLTSLPEEMQGLAKHKGWKEPADALRSYQHLEQTFGADKAGRALIMPKDGEDAEAYDKIYQALGRPEDAAGYELAGMFGEDPLDENFLGVMSQTMHEAGLSKAQAQKLGGVYQEMFKTAQAEAEAQLLSQIDEAERTLPPATKEMAKRGFRMFGLPAEDGQAVSDALVRALGPKAAVELFARLGAAAGEDRPVDGARGVASSSSAVEERERLLADPGFLDRYNQGDPGALARIEQLSIRIAEQNK